MSDRSLVSRKDYILSDGAAWALVLAMLLRGGYNYYMTKHLGWFDSQLVLAAVLLGSLYLAGSLVPRRFEFISLWLVGGLSWSLALTTLFWWGLWWNAVPLREYRAGWQLYAAATVVVFGLVIRLSRRQLALSAISRQGHRWILEWADSQPVLLRLFARRILRLLNYRGPA